MISITRPHRHPTLSSPTLIPPKCHSNELLEALRRIDQLEEEVQSLETTVLIQRAKLDLYEQTPGLLENWQ